MKRIDMHAHTNASDGLLSATELIAYALRRNLGGVAVTDHDTVDALAEARVAASAHPDFWMLPGIEFSTEVNDTEVHLLGYGIDEKDPHLLNLLHTLKDSRLHRAERMVEKLNLLGIAISYEEVSRTAGDGIVGRVHIARVLMNHRVVPSIQEAFRQYLNRHGPAYVPRFKLTPAETIPLIHELGGFSVLAHPGLMKDDHLIEPLIETGLMGIEAYYPTHSDRETQQYLRMAHQYDLLVTGGSDFHAPPGQKIRESDLGQCSVPIEPIRRFYQSFRKGCIPKAGCEERGRS